jgi:hypothetical protein
MIFNKHLDLVGHHAFLSASKYSWLNYDDEKIDVVYRNSLAAQRGTEIHEFAAKAIKLGIKLPRSHTTLNDYVNDAIGYHMLPEQVLFYSDNVFGTTDAISFRKGQLRIHDLKTGVTKASEIQLEIYAALFCLEYRVKPPEISMELRIYQSDEVIVYIADPDDILHIMDKITTFDDRINAVRMEEQR